MFARVPSVLASIYLARAKHCLADAEKSKFVEHRQAWVTLARQWLRLAVSAAWDREDAAASIG